MLKNILAVLVVCVVLSSCWLTTPIQPKTDPCSEKQLVADSWKGSIKEISDLVGPPTEMNVRYLTLPLERGFIIDDAQCTGYTEQVRDASKMGVKKRAKEITPTLLKICSMTNDGEIDVSLLARERRERMGAKEALLILGEPVAGCLAN